MFQKRILVGRDKVQILLSCKILDKYVPKEDRDKVQNCRVKSWIQELTEVQYVKGYVGGNPTKRGVRFNGTQCCYFSFTVSKLLVLSTTLFKQKDSVRQTVLICTTFARLYSIDVYDNTCIVVGSYRKLSAAAFHVLCSV